MNTFEIPPKLIAIHDISGFGRCSLTLAIPLLSAMGIQVCPLPTAVLSTHTTEFTDFTFHDLSSELYPILKHWEKLNLLFDGVYSGFLATHTQIDVVTYCIKNMLKKEGLAIIDPVMGDNGKKDPTITEDIVLAMKKLITHAKVITPNYTEACFLLDEDPNSHIIPNIKGYLKRLSAMGPEIVVITSAPCEDKNQITVAVYEKSKEKFYTLHRPVVPAFYPGTGDTFASVLAGCLLKKNTIEEALQTAVHFVTTAIEYTYRCQTIPREGILIEPLLSSLIPLKTV